MPSDHENCPKPIKGPPIKGHRLEGGIDGPNNVVFVPAKKSGKKPINLWKLNVVHKGLWDDLCQWLDRRGLEVIRYPQSVVATEPTTMECLIGIKRDHMKPTPYPAP